MVTKLAQNFFEQFENWFRSKFVNYEDPNSFSTKLRRKRAAFFNSLIEQSLSTSSSIRILDVGGRQNYWEMVDFYKYNSEKIQEITLLNTQHDLETNNLQFRVVKDDHPKFNAVLGDARDMRQFKDKEFDVVFSNSVIEHLRDYEGQQCMADEVKRVGKRYFIQTPNLYFPIEAHFIIPFIQFYPTWLKVFVLRNKIEDKDKLIEFITHIRLLSKREMMALFPGATIFEEKVFGLTKSFVAYDGWEKVSSGYPSLNEVG